MDPLHTIPTTGILVIIGTPGLSAPHESELAANIDRGKKSGEVDEQRGEAPRPTREDEVWWTGTIALKMYLCSLLCAVALVTTPFAE